MDNTLKIKLSIGDRVYPMRILPHQEEGFRKAAKSINDMINQFEMNYELKDKTDALAMCAISLATRIEQSKLNEDSQVVETKEKLEEIHTLIDEIAQKNVL